MGAGTGVEALLRNVSAGAATELFILVIGAVLAIALYQGFSGKHGRFLENAPNLLTSLGILGTFVGIVIGLLDFDTRNIDTSIQALLEGLKTAFITSLAGMTASIALKGIDAWKFAPMRDAAPTEDGDVTAKHMFGVMRAQELHLRQIETKFGSIDSKFGELEPKLSQLIKAIAGDEEGTLVGQLKLLRTDVGDFKGNVSRHQVEFERRLFEQLRDFSNLLAKSATEAVIDALRQVIVDFNKNLVEQFGDNFKALDQSVQKLVVWQAEYRTHVETLQARLEAAIASVERTATATEAISASLGRSNDAMASIDQSCQRIPVSMQSLEGVLNVNQHQIGELQRHLQAFIEAREKAVQAVPEIKQRMEQLATELSKSMGSINQALHEGALEFGQSVNRTTAAVGEMANTVTSSSEKMQKDLGDASTTFSKSMSDALARLNDTTTKLPGQLQTVVKNFGEAVQSSVATATENIRKVVEATVRDTTEEVQRSTAMTLKDSQASTRDATNAMSKAVSAQIEQAARLAGESINQQMQAMNRALEAELNTVFKAFGSALTTISRRIADDHDALRRQQRTP